MIYSTALRDSHVSSWDGDRPTGRHGQLPELADGVRSCDRQGVSPERTDRTFRRSLLSIEKSRGGSRWRPVVQRRPAAVPVVDPTRSFDCTAVRIGAACELKTSRSHQLPRIGQLAFDYRYQYNIVYLSVILLSYVERSRAVSPAGRRRSLRDSPFDAVALGVVRVLLGRPAETRPVSLPALT